VFLIIHVIMVQVLLANETGVVRT